MTEQTGGYELTEDQDGVWTGPGPRSDEPSALRDSRAAGCGDVHVATPELVFC